MNSDARKHKYTNHQSFIETLLLVEAQEISLSRYRILSIQIPIAKPFSWNSSISASMRTYTLFTYATPKCIFFLLINITGFERVLTLRLVQNSINQFLLSLQESKAKHIHLVLPILSKKIANILGTLSIQVPLSGSSLVLGRLL